MCQINGTSYRLIEIPLERNWFPVLSLLKGLSVPPSSLEIFSSMTPLYGNIMTCFRDTIESGFSPVHILANEGVDKGSVCIVVVHLYFKIKNIVLNLDVFADCSHERKKNQSPLFLSSKLILVS